MPHNSQLPAHSLHWLVTAAVITVVLWQIPVADRLLYPFALLATWFHEMAHGVAAILMGGDFKRLELHPDTSGVATYSYPLGLGSGLSQAFIAASGPLGPAVAGSIFILCGKWSRIAGFALALLGVILMLSVILWIRDLFGALFVMAAAAVIWLITWKATEAIRAFSIQFLGIQACVSSYKQIGYLFTSEAEIGGQIMYSDTMQIQQQLALPYWFWGIAIILLSMAMLFGALWYAYKDVQNTKRPKLLITR